MQNNNEKKEVEVRYKKFFNPKLSDFLEDNKDITFLMFIWSFAWRYCIVIFGIAMIFTVISEL